MQVQKLQGLGTLWVKRIFVDNKSTEFNHQHSWNLPKNLKDKQEKRDTFPRRADSQSTPIQTPSQSKRRRRRAKKAVLLATPRITNWFPRTPLKIPDTPEDTPKQATPPPTIPSKIKKRASRKKKDAPSPILGSPSPYCIPIFCFSFSLRDLFSEYGSAAGSPFFPVF